MRLFGKCFLFLFFVAELSAQNPDRILTKLNDSLDVITIEKQFVFNSDDIFMDINYILDKNELFDQVSNPFINAGPFHKVTWGKISVENKSVKNNFIFEFNQTYIDSLQFFIVKNNKVVKQFKKKGLYFQHENSDNFLSNKYAYVYPLVIAENEKLDLYFKAVVNDGAFRVINKLWTEQAYELRKKDIKIRTSYLLVFGGFIILILIMSIAMYLFSKQLMYLYYVGFVVVVYVNLLCLRHLISPVIIQDTILFGNNFVEMFSYLQVFFMLMYANEFFSLKKKQPKFYFVLNYLALTVITIFVFGLFLRNLTWFYKFSYYVSKSLIGIVSFIIYYVAFYLVSKKEKMAYYFVIAYFPLLTFVIHFILTAMKLTTSYNPVQWEFVILFEIVVLAIAMSHKYFLVIRENLSFQKLIISQKEEGLVAILSAQEEERERIAKDLHDGVVQQIGSVLLRARNILTRLKLIDKKESQDLLQSLEDSNEDLRVISHQMMPRTLKQFGILSAIDDLLNKSLTYAKIQFAFEYFNINTRIKEGYELILFRVLQELINNILKHSKATEVNIQLFKTKEALVLLVEDNGVGFDASIKHDGIGLRNILSRVETVKGEVHFESELKKGTLVTIKIPYL